MSFVLPEARLAYLDLLNRDSLHGSAWFQLAQVARVVGDPEDLVRTYYRKSIRINPRDYLSYFYLGSSLADSSETRHEGEFFLRKSLDINPFFLPAIERLGSYYSALKLDSLAALFYAEAADLRPKNPDFWFYLGESVRKLKLSDSAVVCFGRAIELDSTNAAYVGQFGYAYVQMKAYALAVAAYEHAILLEPDNPQFYSNLAIAYQRMDSVDAAVAAYEKALTYEPNSTESMFFLALALDQRK
jgi:superkiller protein 3